MPESRINAGFFEFQLKFESLRAHFFMFSKRLKAAENLHFRKERFSKSSEVFGKYKQKYKHEEKGQFLR